MNELFVSQKISSLHKAASSTTNRSDHLHLFDFFFANIAYMDTDSSITQFLTNIGPDHLLLIIVIIDVCIINIIIRVILLY